MQTKFDLLSYIFMDDRQTAEVYSYVNKLKKEQIKKYLAFYDKQEDKKTARKFIFQLITGKIILK